MSEAPHELSARSLAYAVRSGSVRATDVTRHFLARIAKVDPHVDAYVAVDPDFALRLAGFVDAHIAAGENAGPLAGVPFAIKDNLCTSWMPTTCASAHLAGWTPPYDADAVTRLMDAGAIPLGKTNLDEFAMGSSTEFSAHGPTRNPWDRRCVPGGSSGGSAAAVAAGLATFALGSDTGGSVRQPAALCGVVGAVGTYGRVSRRGLVAHASSLDRVGVLTRSSADAALLLELLSGGDSDDATSLREPAPAWTVASGHGAAGMTIGILRSEVPVDPDVQTLCVAAVSSLAQRGARIVETRLGHLEDALSAYYLVAAAEASSNLARFDGVRYGERHTEPGDDFERAVSRTRGRGFGPEVKRRILLGTCALTRGYEQRFHEQAARIRRLVADELAGRLEDADVIVCPASPFPAFPLGARTDDPLSMYRCDVFGIPASLAGLPALSAPVGRTADGLPVGLQVVAPAMREDLLFRVAGALQEQFGQAPVAEPAP